MKPRNEGDHIVGRTNPELLIAYLFYALEDIRGQSPRAALLLANAITALAEDSQLNADAIKKSMRVDLLLQ